MDLVVEEEVVMDVSNVENRVTSLENVPSPEVVVVVEGAITVSSVEAVDISPEIAPQLQVEDNPCYIYNTS